ncbi:MAG: citrate/2-methylcitrate synthase, partial [Candidatus Hydrogenedentes bacterium]|nr:citrate/2-methylcitrate synthase [Candidatus Hydrogenedentota bacterium]
MTEQKTYSPGLEGVIAGETAVSCVDQGKLLYRGYPIQQLAEQATFEEVVHLMLYGDLPDEHNLQRIKVSLDEFRPLDEAVIAALRGIPKDVPMMDVLRTMVSYASHFDPVKTGGDEGIRQRALFLTAQIGSLIAARYRMLNDQEPLPHHPGLSHAAQILYQSKGEQPSDLAAELLDLTLVLYAEHEFNASTFTCRVITGTGSDMYSAIA